MALKHYLPALPAEFPTATGTPPATPADKDYVDLDGNLIRWDATAAQWIPVEARRLAQLPYDTDIADVEVFVTNDRWPLGHKFTKHEGHWIDPALPLVCPDCGQSQIVEPSGAGTRLVVNSAADLQTLKAGGGIADGDVVHLRHPDGGTGAEIVGAFDLRGDRVTGRANPMANGAPGTPVRFTADPDVLIRPAAADIAIDVGEVDHVWVENVSIVGGFSCIRYGGVRGTAEHYCRIGHVELREVDESAHLAIQAFNSDITAWSEYVRVLCPKIGPARTDTLNPQETEGFYGGSGNTATIGQDKSHHIEILYPKFVDMVADPLELKRGVTDIYIKDGKATNTNYLPAGPNGGAGQGVLGLLEPGVNYATDVDDARIVVDGFEIDGYNDLYAVAIGQGGVTVKNLKVSNATGAAAALASVRVRSVAPYGIGADGGMPIIIEGITTDAATAVQVWDPEGQNPVVIQRDKAPGHLSVAQFSGRTAYAANDTWYGANEQWGYNNEVWIDARGTGATPAINNQNDRTGIIIPPGATVERIHYAYRINNADVTDFEVAFGLLTPIDATSYDDGLTNANQLEWRPVYQSLRSAFPAGNSNGTNRPYMVTFECGVTNRSAKPVDLTYHSRRTAGGNRNNFWSFAVEISMP